MAKSKANAARDDGPTLAEVVASTGLIGKITTTTRSIISRSVAQADEQGRVMLRVVSCHTCTAPKACCSLHTAIWLYEAIPIVARIVAEGRDTPAFRAQLRASAEAMENTPRVQYRRPCVFLDADERCTVYTERPAVCGVALVYSPAELCGQTRQVDAYIGQLQIALSPKIDAGVSEELGLPRREHRYQGVLPRMILIVLQAWGRSDYARFIAQHASSAAARLTDVAAEG